MIRAKDNPFRISRIKAMGYLPQAMSQEQIRQRLDQLDNVAAIVGPHGSGKTTLLRELEIQVRCSGIETHMLFMSLDIPLPWQTVCDCIDSINPGGILFFDGACHLSNVRFWQLRQKIRKRNIGLVITSHDEGLLDTLIVCRPGVNLLAEITDRLLGEEKLLDEDILSVLYSVHSGNIRDCLWDLYDYYNDRESPADQSGVNGE